MKSSWLISFFILSLNCLAGDHDRLQLMGIVLPQSNTNMRMMVKGPNHVQWIINHRRNSHNLHDEKIEIEGLGQEGLQGKIVQVTDNGKFIRHEILLDLIAFNYNQNKPVVLKISAN